MSWRSSQVASTRDNPCQWINTSWQSFHTLWSKTAYGVGSTEASSSWTSGSEGWGEVSVPIFFLRTEMCKIWVDVGSSWKFQFVGHGPNPLEYLEWPIEPRWKFKILVQKERGFVDKVGVVNKPSHRHWTPDPYGVNQKLFFIRDCDSFNRARSSARIWSLSFNSLSTASNWVVHGTSQSSVGSGRP